MRVKLTRGGRADDERDHHLAPLVVGRPDYARLFDTWVLEQCFLHLTWIDVAAAADHHVLGTVAKGEVSPVVERPHVAGAQPPVLQRGGGRLGVVPVARHHDVTAAHDLTDLTDRGRRTVVAQHRDIYPGPGVTN